MSSLKIVRPFFGTLGQPLNFDLLPSPGTTRWVVRRKAEVVAAIEGGLRTNDQACERYSLSLEELTAWQRSVERAGLAGLRTTRIQHYRERWKRQGY